MPTAHQGADRRDAQPGVCAVDLRLALAADALLAAAPRSHVLGDLADRLQRSHRRIGEDRVLDVVDRQHREHGRLAEAGEAAAVSLASGPAVDGHAYQLGVASVGISSSRPRPR